MPITTKTDISDFDFDYWLRLHQENPEDFDSMKKNLVSYEIIKSKNPKQLHYLQFKIDAICLTNKGVYKRMILLNKMMRDSLDELNSALNSIK